MIQLLEEEFILKEGKYNIIDIDHVPSEEETTAMLEEAGKEKKTKMINHDEKKITSFSPVERRQKLEQGWRDVMRVNKKNEKGKVCQKYVDPRDFETKYSKEGWEPGWPYQTMYKRVNGEPRKVCVSPTAVARRLSQGWRNYIETWVNKKITLKDGREDYENRMIDKDQVADYVAQGWELGPAGGQEQKKADWYNKSFSIMASNGKLGDVGNLSVVPVETCPSDVPCKNQGCYALKCYRQYPDVRLAWGKNTKLLKEHPEWLVRDMNHFLQVTQNGYMTMFRWNVAGDIFSKEYLDAIIQIAKDNPGTRFWLYTKNYSMVTGITPPENLIIILSAWNDWNLDLIDGDDATHTGKGGLHRQFPVAYLDDWDHKDMIPKDDDPGVFICPCADEKDADLADDRHCASCKTHSIHNGKMGTHPCYLLKPGESVIFRKH